MWIRLFVVAMAALTAFGADVHYTITSVAGTNDVGDGQPARTAQLAGAEGLAVDGNGNIYIADHLDHRVRKVTAATGLISTLAGTGQPGPLDRPYGVAYSSGFLYVADFGNGRICRISQSGEVQVVAGGGSGGGATAARLVGPRNVAADGNGSIYVSDFLDHRVYRVTASGGIQVFAGTGNAEFNGDGPATSTNLNSPAGLAVDRNGAVYIADSGNQRIRKVANGVMTTVLSGIVAGEELATPTGVAVDGSGRLYVADSGNRRVLRRTPSGGVVTIASEETGLESARDVTADFLDRVWVADGAHIYQITNPGLELVAGDGTYGISEEGDPAVESYLNAPVGVEVDDYGAVYIAEEAAHRVRKVDPDGKLHTLAGTGEKDYSGDGGPAGAAALIDPVDVAGDTLGNIWIADYTGQRVRRVTRGGLIQTDAGTGKAGFGGDLGPADTAQLNRPRAVTRDLYSNLYIADSYNHRVRRVAYDGRIDTVAGSGVRGFSGNRGLAVHAQLDLPAAVVAAPDGTLYIAEQGNHVVRRVRPDGFLFPYAGTGEAGYSGDGGPATSARLNAPSGLALDEDGNLYIADTNNHRIRRVTPDGVIETVAGDGFPGFEGDGGSAWAARFRFPSDVAVDYRGRLFVADSGNNRIRMLVPSAPPAEPPPPIVEPSSESAVMHAATFGTGPVAPGQIVSVFGAGIGPTEPANARLTANGVIESALGSTVVEVNGVAAPLLYAASGQVNAQIPYSVADTSEAVMEVWVNGELHSRSVLEVRPAAPGLFTLDNGAGQVVALNQDGSLNSSSNPAARGSIVVLYATGEGQTDPIGVDGKPSEAPYPKPVLPVQVRIGGLPSEILFAGSAPGFAGLMQINVRIPGGFIPSGNLAVELFVGSYASQHGVTIAVQ